MPKRIYGNFGKHQEMRIVQVITLGHELYGAQKHVLDLAIAFKENGHEVVVVVGTTGALTDLCRRRGIEWHQIRSLQRSIRPWRDLKACAELADFLNVYKPDVVASHSSKAGLVARWVCFRLGIANTFTAHGWSFEDGVPFLRRLVFRLIEKLVGRISDKIITVSQRGKELALRHKIVPESKLAMIHYGTEDVGAVHSRNQQATFTMSMVAGFREQKDHASLVHALKELKDHDWQIFFLGDGPLQSDVVKLVEQCGLSDRVFFEGMVEEVASYLAKTDLLVLSTNWEGLPISTLEGLSFGLPVVASDVSGVREQVVHEYNGLLTRRGDPEDIRRAIVSLLDDRVTLAKYGRNSRKLYLAHFTHEMMYQATCELYESLLEHQSRNRS